VQLGRILHKWGPGRARASYDDDRTLKGLAMCPLRLPGAAP